MSLQMIWQIIIDSPFSACKKYPYRQGPLDKSQKTLSFEGKLEGAGDSVASNLVVHKYNPDKIPMVVAEMITTDEQTFRIVEGL